MSLVNKAAVLYDSRSQQWVVNTSVRNWSFTGILIITAKKGPHNRKIHRRKSCRMTQTPTTWTLNCAPRVKTLTPVALFFCRKLVMANETKLKRHRLLFNERHASFIKCCQIRWLWPVTYDAAVLIEDGSWRMNRW